LVLGLIGRGVKKDDTVRGRLSEKEIKSTAHRLPDLFAASGFHASESLLCQKSFSQIRRTLLKDQPAR
jgi:hypothetical protein